MDQSKSPVSLRWAAAVPLIAWWPVALVIIEVAAPRSPATPYSAEVDWSPLFAMLAGIVWIVLIPATVVIAAIAGAVLDRAVADRSAESRKRLGLVVGGAVLLVAAAIFAGRL